MTKLPPLKAIHPAKTISPYLLSDILKQLEIDEEEFLRALGRKWFHPQEEKTIKPAIASVAEAIKCIITEGITAAMNQFN